MSNEATCGVQSDLIKEDIIDIEVELDAEENVKQNVESNARYSNRSVTINDNVTTSIKETSFMDHQHDVENRASVNNENYKSTDDIINIDNTHDDDDKNFVNKTSSRAKCLNCLSEVFECTIWFFKSIASSIRAKLQNCCAYNKKSVNIKSREFDDDGEYWNGNVMNNEGEEGVITFNLDSKDNVMETDKTLYKNELIEAAKDHSKDKMAFEAIYIKDDYASEQKSVDEPDCSKSNGNGHRNSTTSVVCHVNVHDGSKENAVVCNAINEIDHNYSGYDCGNNTGNDGGNGGGNDGSNDGGNDEGNVGGNDGGNDGGNVGGNVGDN